MRITPLDVRKQEFRKVVRGLDADEVRAFLITVADEYEAVLVDNKQLRERILGLEDKIGEYRNMEKTLRDTLMTAERVLTETKDNAIKEADLLIKDAELQARRILDGLRTEAEAVRREIVQLHQEKESYLSRFKGLVEAQDRFVASHHTDFEELDRRLLSLVESAGTYPTRATKPQAADAEPAPPVSAAGPARERDEWRDYSPQPRKEPAAPAGESEPSPPTSEADRAPAGAQDPAAAPGDEKAGPLEAVRVAEMVEQMTPGEQGADKDSPPPAPPVEATAAKPGTEEKPGRWDADRFTKGLSEM